MYPIKYICNTGWDLDKYLKPLEKKTALVVNTIPRRPTDLYYYDTRIFLHTEPEDIIRGLELFLFTHWEFFDYILTFDEELLKGLPNSIKFLVAVPWAKDVDKRFNDKKFQVSFIPGSKNNTMGHRLRHVVYRKQNKIKIPKKFIPSLEYNNSVRQEVLFNTSQYNIAIENSRHNNYFTEKIVDCFLTKTIPVYWGCPNIGDYFDKDGIIEFDKEYDMYDRLNWLDKDYYESKKAAIDANYITALERYGDVGEQGSNYINQILGALNA